MSNSEYPDTERLTLNVEEVAKYLGLSRGKTYDMARQNLLPVLRCGRRLLISRKLFDAYLCGEWQPQGDKNHGR